MLHEYLQGVDFVNTELPTPESYLHVTQVRVSCGCQPVIDYMIHYFPDGIENRDASLI